MDGLAYYQPPVVLSRPTMEQKLGELLAVREEDEDEKREILMKETLPHRRQDILSRRITMKKLREMYPFIFGAEEVILLS